MKKRNYLKGREGFSLVEVVVALAIATFALLGILALVTVSQQSTKASSDDTRLSQISEQVFHQVQIDLATDAAFLSPKSLNSSLPSAVWFDSSANPDTSNGGPPNGQWRNYYFDDQGTLLSSSTGALYTATVTVGPINSANLPPNVETDPSNPAMLKALVIKITWPFGVTPGTASSRTYSMLLRNRGSYGNSSIYTPPYP